MTHQKRRLVASSSTQQQATHQQRRCLSVRSWGELFSKAVVVSNSIILLKLSKQKFNNDKTTRTRDSPLGVCVWLNLGIFNNNNKH